MDQSTYILGSIIAGFVIFITVRGELPRYMGFLIGSPNQGTPTITPQQFGFSAPVSNPTPASGGGSTNNSGGLSLDTIIHGAEIAATLLA